MALRSTTGSAPSLPSVRDLKRRYKLLLAERRALHTVDLGISLPISTGDPVLDAALLEKLVPTATMGEAEHFARGWELARASGPHQHTLLREHARALLHDHKMLHAIAALERGDDATLRAMLDALPWAWRLAFPSAVIKPASAMLTGWRRGVRFRVIEPPFDRLRTIFRDAITRAPDDVILKFRDTIKQSAALLRFRFEGERERAIHDLCFEHGREAAASGALPAATAFVQARDALARDGLAAFVRVLDAAPGSIPLTSLAGLYGQAGVRLDRADAATRPTLAKLRGHALASASGVEMLLRLNEWGPWLDDAHCELVCARVREAVAHPRVSLPFFKVLAAFEAAPGHVRSALARPLLVPLMERFGEQLRALLPAARDYTFVLPASMLRMTSLMLYAMVARAGDARLVLLRTRGLAEPPPVALADVVEQVSAGTTKRWLEKELGAVAHDASYTYDVQAIARRLAALDPREPLLLDVPFLRDPRLLEALLPFDLAINLSSPLGAPGELTVGYEFYTQVSYATPHGGWAVLARGGDVAATRFAELIDRLQVMSAMAEVEATP